jgi:tRNA1(Val) A37 N6-methylase TrmN6
MFLYQPSNGYRYNSDSIFLYDFIRRFRPQGAVLDVGSGVGIVGLLIARDWPVQMYIIDKQPEMIAYAAHNYTLNGLEVETHVGDFATFTPERRFEMIVSNPPFYDPSVTQSDDTVLNAARYAHHLPMDRLIAQAKRLLKPRGYFVFVYDAKQIDAILWHLREAKLNPETIRFVHPKADREAKVAFIAARANSRAMLRVLPPLIVFDAQSRYRPEAQAAFDRAATHSVTGDRSV